MELIDYERRSDVLSEFTYGHISEQSKHLQFFRINEYCCLQYLRKNGCESWLISGLFMVTINAKLLQLAF